MSGAARLVLEPVTPATVDEYRRLDELLRAEGYCRRSALHHPRPGSIYLVARVQGTVVGRATIPAPAHDRPREGDAGCAVHPAFRRRGYGAAILRQCVAVLGALGATEVQLTCREDNAASAAMIERIGGRLTGTITARRDGAPIRQYVIDAEKERTGEHA